MLINRNPITPKLTPKAIKLLTKLCFRADKIPKKVDGIFVFSSSIGLTNIAKLLKRDLKRGIAKRVFITGGLPPGDSAKELGVTGNIKEADLLLKYLPTDKFTDVKFLVEKKSTNTLTNVTETLKFKEFKKCKSLLFIFKSHASGRGYLTLRKFFPQSDIYQQSLNTKYSQANKSITRDNWSTFPFGRERVWGEFLRIKTYGQRGDIEYNSVKALVKDIDSIVNLSK